MALYGVSRSGDPTAAELKLVRRLDPAAQSLGELRSGMAGGEIFLVWDSEEYGPDEDLDDSLARIRKALEVLAGEIDGLQFHYSPAAGDPWEHVLREELENLMASEVEIHDQQYD